MKQPTFCSGCRNDIYNHGHLGTKQCWSLPSAKKVWKQFVPWNQSPPHWQTPELTFSCHQRQGYAGIAASKPKPQKPPKPTCCVSGGHCLAPSKVQEYRKRRIRTACAACGQPVCQNCSKKVTYQGVKKTRLCQHCLIKSQEQP